MLCPMAAECFFSFFMFLHVSSASSICFFGTSCPGGQEKKEYISPLAELSEAKDPHNHHPGNPQATSLDACRSFKYWRVVELSPPPSHRRGAPTVSKYSSSSKPLSAPPLARLELWHGFAVTVAYPPIVDSMWDSPATQSATTKNRLRAELVSKLYFIFFLCIGFGWLCPGHNAALKCTSFLLGQSFKT